MKLYSIDCGGGWGFLIFAPVKGHFFKSTQMYNVSEVSSNLYKSLL